MTNLRIDPESERLLDERLKSPEGRKLMDDLLRMIAMGLVDEWVRNGIANRQSSLHLFAQHPGISSPVRLGASQVRRQTIQQRSLAFRQIPEILCSTDNSRCSPCGN